MITAADYFLNIKKELIAYYSAKDLSSIHFVGLDCSLTSTGFSVINNNKQVYGCEIGSKYYSGKRLWDLSIQVIRKIEQYPNSLILMENYSFNARNTNSLTGLAEFGGCLKMLFHKRGLKYLLVAPTTLKKYIYKGSFKKAMMPFFVNKKFGLEIIGPDHADAVGLAFLGYNAFRFAKDMKLYYTVKEIECFNTILSLSGKPKTNKKTNRQLALELTT